MDEDDDIYPESELQSQHNPHSEVKMEDIDYDEEEGEEVEDDDSDDEINFITDTKEEAKTESQPTSQAKRPIPITADPRKASASATPVPGLKTSPDSQQTSTTTNLSQIPLHQPSQSQTSRQPSSQPPYQIRQGAHGIHDDSQQQQQQRPPSRPGSSYPGRHTSTLDLNANPIHPATGKPIFQTDLDIDFNPSSAHADNESTAGTAVEDTKPWRKPGADVSDYFNYGFDEFTWASYCLKRQELGKEVGEIRSGAEGMKSFLEGFGGMPGFPGMSANPTSAGAGVNGSANGNNNNNNGHNAMMGGGGVGGSMPGMPSEAEMQQMFQGMMAQGMDPSTMDPSQFMQMMMSGGGGGGGGGGGAGGFGANQPPTGPAMGFGGGFDQGGGGFQGGGGGGGGGGRGRGRRGRGNW